MKSLGNVTRAERNTSQEDIVVHKLIAMKEAAIQDPYLLQSKAIRSEAHDIKTYITGESPFTNNRRLRVGACKARVTLSMLSFENCSFMFLKYFYVMVYR